MRRDETSALDPDRAARGGRPVTSRSLLVAALPLLPHAAERDRPLLAVDLDCRDRLDSLALLRQGWTVLAITATPAAKRRLVGEVPQRQSARLTVEVCDFDELALPVADLVYSGAALSSRPQPAFGRLWGRIVPALRPGGWLVGQFVGDRDVRAGGTGLTVLTRKQIVTLLNGFRIECLRERETAAEHAFDVLARRRPLHRGPGGDSPNA